MLARKVDVSEWVLQQEQKCLGKLLQALLRAASLMDIFMNMQPPVKFNEGLLLPHFICESFRYVHLKDHDSCNWADVSALVCTARRALVSEEQRRSLIGDAAAILSAIARERGKAGALGDIMVGQVLSDIARARLEDELALVCSPVSFLDNPIASAGVVDMVRPIEEEAMAARSDAMRA